MAEIAFQVIDQVTVAMDLDNLIDVGTTDRGFHTIYGALDTDVESAQIAAEIKIENLIRSLGNTSVVASRATVVVPHP